MPYERLTVGEVPLGVGHLRPVEAGYIWDWQLGMRLPLFAEPGGDPAGWIADGWIVGTSGAPEVLGTAGTIETSYEIVSFIVLEHRDDGWLRVRHGASEESTAWTHECAFGLGPVELVFESWEDRLTSADISPLFFVAEEPHPLRAGATDADAEILSIPAESRAYEIAPLEVRGDWMRVRVSMPPTYCAFDAPSPESHEGWVRWRDPERGPLLWYYTRGC